MKEEIQSCISCGSEVDGNYCKHCGQKVITPEDKKLSHLFEEILASLFFADGKLVRSFKKLLLHPGVLSNSYIKGIRRKFLSPLQMFFFANLLYFLFPMLSTFNTSLNTQMNRLPYSDLISPVVQEHLENNDIPYEEFKVEFEKKSTSNGKLLLFVLVFLQALLLQLLFFRKEGFYFVDFIASAAYFNAFYILVLLVMLPTFIILPMQWFSIDLSAYLNEAVVSIVFVFGILIYLYFFIQRIFDTSPLETIIKSLVLTVFLIPTFIIYRFILFWVTFWMVS